MISVINHKEKLKQAGKTHRKSEEQQIQIGPLEGDVDPLMLMLVEDVELNGPILCF